MYVHTEPIMKYGRCVCLLAQRVITMMVMLCEEHENFLELYIQMYFTVKCYCINCNVNKIEVKKIALCYFQR